MRRRACCSPPSLPPRLPGLRTTSLSRNPTAVSAVRRFFRPESDRFGRNLNSKRSKPVLTAYAHPANIHNPTWRSANLEKFRLRRSFARGPAPSTPVLEEPLDFEAGREKKEGFLNLISSGPMWSNVGPMWPLPRHPKWSNVPQNVKSQHWRGSGVDRVVMMLLAMSMGVVIQMNAIFRP